MFTPLRHFSQNFLCDNVVVDNLMSVVNPKKGERFVEIGAGTGILTERLADCGVDTWALEIDERLVTHLKQKFVGNGSIRIIQHDALLFDYHQIPAPFRLIGNLPYHLSTALLSVFLKDFECITDMHVMLQKEVANRLVATKGRARSWQSVLAEYCCHCQKLFDVSPKAFEPEPKVFSSIIQLVSKQGVSHSPQQLSSFITMLQMAFSQKRKMLRNNFSKHLTAVHWQAIGIDASQRAEQLPLEDFVRLHQWFMIHQPEL